MRDYWKDPNNLTPRRLVTLIKGLPPESLYQTALREYIEEEDIELDEPDPNKHGAWSRQDHLLAQISDLLAVIKWQNENQGVDKAKQTQFPKPMPRPGIENKKKPLDLVVMQQMQADRLERNRIIEEQERQSITG